MAVDLVYILGKGSAWNDNELRFSLRSVEKYVTGYRSIFLVGYKPDWMNDNVKFIPCQDLYSNKERNIYHKINTAAGTKEITRNFMIFNDDYFFTKPTNIIDYPYYYKCDLITSAGKNITNPYGKDIKATIDVLVNNRLPLLNFDTHKPIIYNKKLWHEVTAKYNWNVPHGYLTKSIYCNSLKIEGMFEADSKINHPHITDSLKTILASSKSDMFSIGDRALNKSMISLLNELYPNKSRFEK